MNKVTTKEFVEKAKKVHGNKYDYSKTVYVSQDEKVIITCPIHGDFETTPKYHLKGGNCPKCSRNELKHTNSSFVENARAVHGDKYDYSKVDYINAKEKVEVVCPKHGSFWVTPNNHVSKKSGCPFCSFEKKATGGAAFIEKARKVHGDRYDYSRVIYKNASTKVEIICKKHGPFMMTPHAHLQGKNCPKCRGKKNREENEK